MDVPLLAQWTRPPPSVLLAEHEVDTRRMYATYLRLSSCSVEESDNGAEALAKAIVMRPTVVVADAVLPSIGGFELSTLLRADPATESTCIVVVTSAAIGRVRAHAIEAADAVLVKPCAPDVLLAEVARVLDRGAVLRQRSSAARLRAYEQIARSDRLIAVSEHARRAMMSHTHQRYETTEPPLAPPALRCPVCDQPLQFVRSNIGGVTTRYAEQWDYFECLYDCGTFQYRHRTRKVRKV